MSAGLYLSGIFAIFAPLPLLIVALGDGWAWAALAALTNSALVYFSSGPATFQMYLLVVASVGLAVPFGLRRATWSLERVTAFAWGVQMLLMIAVLGVYAQLHGLTLFQELERITGTFLDSYLSRLTPEIRGQILGDLDPAEWRRQTTLEMPSALATVGLLLNWANLFLVLRLNPGRILQRTGREPRYFPRWKTAQGLVWVAIVSWAFVLWSSGPLSDAATNVFKFLMAVYALQGLAILSFYLDVWRIGGFFRTLAFFLALFLMMPLVLSIGFFDHWFDFRAKFRQS